MKNMAFIPNKDGMGFFMLQLIWFALFITAISIAVKDRVEATYDDDPERQLLDLYPLCVTVVIVLTRIIIISIRHGTSSYSIWSSQS